MCKFRPREFARIWARKRTQYLFVIMLLFWNENYNELFLLTKIRVESPTILNKNRRQECEALVSVLPTCKTWLISELKVTGSPWNVNCRAVPEVRARLCQSANTRSDCCKGLGRKHSELERQLVKYVMQDLIHPVSFPPEYSFVVLSNRERNVVCHVKQKQILFFLMLWKIENLVMITGSYSEYRDE